MGISQEGAASCCTELPSQITHSYACRSQLDDCADVNVYCQSLSDPKMDGLCVCRQLPRGEQHHEILFGSIVYLHFHHDWVEQSCREFRCVKSTGAAS